MNARLRTPLRALCLALALGVCTAATAAEYDTSFTYQGALKVSGVALNGTADFEFSIYDVPTSGIALALPIVMNDVPVADGVFTVNLDFGTIPQASEERWLQIVVNSTILSPRQKLTPSPLTQNALNADNAERAPIIFAGQIHESPYWKTGGTGAFASPLGITEAVYNVQRAQVVLPRDCTARDLRVRNVSTSGYPDTTVALTVNGVATALSCAQDDAVSPSCANTGTIVSLQAGDLVAMRFLPNLPTRPVTNEELETRGLVMFSWVCE